MRAIQSKLGLGPTLCEAHCQGVVVSGRFGRFIVAELLAKLVNDDINKD